MGESYAGITVPEGEPGELRSAGQALSGASGALEGVAAELRGMPGMLGSWQGPASVNYAGSCLTNEAAVDPGMEALQSCSTAIKRYADELAAARDDARAAIEDAKDAQRRIKLAGAAIEDAQARATAATDSFSVASARVVATGLTGSPSPMRWPTSPPPSRRSPTPRPTKRALDANSRRRRKTCVELRSAKCRTSPPA